MTLYVCLFLFQSLLCTNIRAYILWFCPVKSSTKCERDPRVVIKGEATAKQFYQNESSKVPNVPQYSWYL